MCIVPVTQCGHENVIVWVGKIVGLVMCNDGFVHGDGRAQCCNRTTVAFGLGQCQSEVCVVAFLCNLNVAVFQCLQITGTDETVDHETDCPLQINGHGVLGCPQSVVLA